jgi:hypothetical protein
VIDVESRLTDRRAFVEQRLFEVQVEIERARNEVEFINYQLADLEERATDAVLRLEVAQTPVADRASSTARGRLAQIRFAAQTATQRLGALEATRDDLLSKLVV